jgi:hypothetical protein
MIARNSQKTTLRWVFSEKSHEKTGRCHAQGDSAHGVKFDANLPISRVSQVDVTRGKHDAYQSRSRIQAN